MLSHTGLKAAEFTRHIGDDRIGRKHEHDCISAPDQTLNPLPPILEGMNFCTIY